MLSAERAPHDHAAGSAQLRRWLAKCENPTGETTAKSGNVCPHVWNPPNEDASQRTPGDNHVIAYDQLLTDSNGGKWTTRTDSTPSAEYVRCLSACCYLLILGNTSMPYGVTVALALPPTHAYVRICSR